MKCFLLVCEDLLNGHIHDSPEGEPSSCQVEALSKEALIKGLGLQEIREGRGHRQCWWDGKIGDVIIYIYEISPRSVQIPTDLHAFVRQMHDRWL